MGKLQTVMVAAANLQLMTARMIGFYAWFSKILEKDHVGLRFGP